VVTIGFIVHALFWILGFLFIFHIPLCRSQHKIRVPYPSISVIIPARNEEDTLPTLLSSLKAQTIMPDEIIVIDDKSVDSTGTVARRNGVKLIESEVLPEGWLGKPWACHQGAYNATGQTLVFLDADTILEKDGLHKIMDTFLDSDAVLSVQPYHRTGRCYEQLSALLNIVMMGAANAFTVFGFRLRPSALFGPCIVIKRETYLQIGGHESVKGSVVEDVALARQLKRHKIPLRCCGGKGTISFRMYPHGLGEFIDGWSKGFALGAVQIALPWLLIVSAWITGAIAAVLYSVLSIFSPNSASIVTWGCLYAAYVAQIYWMLVRIGNFRSYLALVYPIPLLAFLFLFVRSFTLVFVKRRVKWKQRIISVTVRRHSDANKSARSLDHTT